MDLISAASKEKLGKKVHAIILIIDEKFKLDEKIKQTLDKYKNYQIRAVIVKNEEAYNENVSYFAQEWKKYADEKAARTGVVTEF